MKIEKYLERNKLKECGPIFCEVCGEFFDDHRRTNILNYDSCKKHKGKEGYSLLERLQRMEKYGVPQ